MRLVKESYGSNVVLVYNKSYFLLLVLGACCVKTPKEHVYEHISSISTLVIVKSAVFTSDC